MPRKHAYGPTVPESGDDLLKAWDTYVRTSTHIVPVGSVAEINALLTSLASAGMAPTSRRPLYFDLNGVIYRSDGYRGPGGTDWDLSPVNQMIGFTATASAPMFNFGRSSGNQQVSLAKDEYWKIMHFAPQVSKVAQSYLVIGQCWTSKHEGNVELELYERPSDTRAYGAKARIAEADDGTTTVLKSGYIPVGAQVDFTMYLHAAPYNAAKLDVSFDEWTYMYVQLTPQGL